MGTAQEWPAGGIYLLRTQIRGGPVMKRIAALAALAVVGVIAPAQADKPKPPTPPKPHMPKPGKPHPSRCVAHRAGYRASGTLLMATLVPQGHRRYSGTLEVAVTRANHHSPTGDQTYTLTNARVTFHHGVNVAAPAPGSRVQLTGKITQLPAHCASKGFTPTITVKKVDIRTAKK
jgi:hypothetical protein